MDLSYAEALCFARPSPPVTIVLVGCGGTGSWLAPSIVRFVLTMNQLHENSARVFFFDPDRVEEKNIYRQNFCFAEIGRNKAETLASRMSRAWGQEIQAVPLVFDSKIGILDWHSKTVVLVGCVDNAAGRKTISTYVDNHPESSYWLDCGNEKSSGQILFGGGEKRVKPLGGMIRYAPHPGKQCPDLLEPLPRLIEQPQGNLSCAELAMAGLQGLSVNQRIAAEAAAFLEQFLLRGTLKRMATYLNLEAGSCRSVYTTPANLAQR